MAYLEDGEDEMDFADDKSPSLISTNQMWMAGGAGALIVALWAKIKSLLSMALSIFIEGFSFDGNTRYSVLRYLNNECKYKYSWNRDICEHYLYLKKYKTRRNCLFIQDTNWIFFKWKFGGLVWYTKGKLTVFKLAKFFDKYADLIFEDHCKLDYGDDQDNFMVKNITGSGSHSTPKGNKGDEEGDISPGDDDRTILLNIKDGILKPIYFDKDDFLLESCADKDPFDDYYLSKGSEQIVRETSKWLEHEKWFKERNILWKRGYCLYGLPGCGKSSFLLRLAKKLRIPLYVFNLSTLSNEELINRWNSIQKPCVALFEDFDAVFEGRKNVSDIGQLQVKLTFDTVLNIVDGTNSCDGVLTFITTNHLEKLDAAILRAGRMDDHIEFKTLGKTGKEFIAQKILNGHVNLYQSILKSTTMKESNAEFENRCIQIALKEFWKTS